MIIMILIIVIAIIIIPTVMCVCLVCACARACAHIIYNIGQQNVYILLVRYYRSKTYTQTLKKISSLY